MKLNLPNRKQVAAEVRNELADRESTDKIVMGKQAPDTRESKREDRKLSQLIEGDFPFDESQLDAIEGISREQYACLTGAAGTGKTTVTKAIVDRIMQQEGYEEVAMHEYFTFSDEEETESDVPEKWIPSIAMCAFTGRASQMVKKNFPEDWHDNIMTIHRLLAYKPEYYSESDDSGQMVNKVRFVPSYNEDLRLPWDYIIIDEAGMTSVDLWHNLWAACKPGCRIIMIGDINQLPPVHGKSVFGFAMAKWPSWELRKVHRQKGKENPIVDNAWRVINGVMPESEGNFQMLQLKGDAQYASRHVRGILPALRDKGIYDPIRDSVITPINGEDGARGFALGQLPLNRELSLIFNPSNENPRYVIDASREIKRFAVGDKVMATKNDWEHGITNGMSGVIMDIQPNPLYRGDWTRFGTIEEVNERMRLEDTQVDKDVAFSLEDLESDLNSNLEEAQKVKEKRERGPSSHIVTVQFGSEAYGQTLDFSSLSEVDSLMTAYVVTCHKMQGGEAPVVVILCHDAHKSMLYREWLYTAITRASQKCILLYTPTALRTALNKQSIKGQSLRAKVESFNDLVGHTDVRLPDTTSTRNLIMNMPEEKYDKGGRFASTAVKEGGLAKLVQKKKAAKPEPKPQTVKVKVSGTFTIRTETTTTSEPEQDPPVDGGRIEPDQPTLDKPEGRAVVPVSPVYTVHQHGRPEPLRLTHQPAEPAKPVNRLAIKLGKAK